MSTVCSETEFRALRNKQYRNIPRALLAAVIKGLPDYAVVVYLTLYDLSELNQKYPGTVLASHLSLSKYLDKSVKSVSRGLKKLKSEGFIEYQEKTQSYHTLNIIQVRCPKSLAEQIIEEEVDRKNVVPLSIAYTRSHRRKHPVSQPISAPDPLIPIDTKVSPSGCSLVQPEVNNPIVTEHDNLLAEDLASKHEPIITSTDLKAESTDNVEQLYQQYQQHFQQLRSAGVSPLNASRQAFNHFTLAQRTALQRYLLSQHHPQFGFAASNETKLSRGVDKNVHPIRINNNRAEQLLLTIDTLDAVDNSTSGQAPAVNSAVHFKKASVVVNGLSREHLTVIKKLKAMHRSGEIHDSLQPKYLNLGVLIKEVLVHTSNPNLNRITGFKHVLNAAAKMIREGTWSTPKQLLYWQGLKREQEAARFKQQELNMWKQSVLFARLNPFIENLRYSSLSTK